MCAPWDLPCMANSLFTGAATSLTKSANHVAGSAMTNAITTANGDTLAGHTITLWGQHPHHNPLSVMAVPALSLVAVIVIAGVVEAVIKGDHREVLRRGVVAPLAVGALAVILIPLLSFGLQLTDWMCQQMVAGLGGAHITHVFSTSANHNALDGFQKLFGPTGAPTGIAGLFVGVLLLVLVTPAALIVLAELVVRDLLIILLIIFLPLSLAGVFWGRTHHWAKHSAELLGAIVFSKVVIVGILCVTALILEDAGGGSSTLTSFAALGGLFLATLGLPMTMKLIPHAAGAVGIGSASQAAHGKSKDAAGHTLEHSGTSSSSGATPTVGQAGDIANRALEHDAASQGALAGGASGSEATGASGLAGAGGAGEAGAAGAGAATGAGIVAGVALAAKKTAQVGEATVAAQVPAPSPTAQPAPRPSRASLSKALLSGYSRGGISGAALSGAAWTATAHARRAPRPRKLRDVATTSVTDASPSTAPAPTAPVPASPPLPPGPATTPPAPAPSPADYLDALDAARPAPAPSAPGPSAQDYLDALDA